MSSFWRTKNNRETQILKLTQTLLQAKDGVDLGLSSDTTFANEELALKEVCQMRIGIILEGLAELGLQKWLLS